MKIFNINIAINRQSRCSKVMKTLISSRSVKVKFVAKDNDLMNMLKSLE